MTLLNAGYWPTTYLPENYYTPLYWPTYGAEEEPEVPQPTVSTPATPSGLIKRSLHFPLTLGLTLQGELVWVYPIQLKKEKQNS